MHCAGTLSAGTVGPAGALPRVGAPFRQPQAVGGALSRSAPLPILGYTWRVMSDSPLTHADDFGPRLFAQTAFAQELGAIPEAAFLPEYSMAAVPELMRRVGGVSDPAALAALAADPNTPAETLTLLAGICPAAFCANPALPLLLLENPALPAEFEPASLGRLLSYEAVPEELLAAVAHLARPELAHAARLHVGLAGELAGGLDAAVEAALAAVPTAPDDDLMALLLLLGLAPAWLRPRAEAAVAARPPLAPAPRRPAAADPAPGPDELAAMLAADSPRDRARAAADPRLPPELLARAKTEEDWGDGDYGVYEALAGNPSTPAAVLVELAADRKALATGARRAVATNPGAPPEALALLADEYYALDIPLLLAAHGNLPPEQRERLAATALERAREGADPLHRAVALARADAPAALLLARARSPHWVERLAVALNPAAPAEARAALVHDGNRLVRAAARGAGQS